MEQVEVVTCPYCGRVFEVSKPEKYPATQYVRCPTCGKGWKEEFVPEEVQKVTYAKRGSIRIEVDEIERQEMSKGVVCRLHLNLRNSVQPLELGISGEMTTGHNEIFSFSVDKRKVYEISAQPQKGTQEFSRTEPLWLDSGSHEFMGDLYGGAPAELDYYTKKLILVREPRWVNFTLELVLPYVKGRVPRQPVKEE